MRNLLASALFALFSITLTTAQAPPAQTITLQRDGAALAADFYPAADAAPVILLLHMLNSERAAWDPLIPDLRAAGYALLNMDMRGHGQSGGARDWDAAIADLTDGWIGWLGGAGHLSEGGLAIIGGSIGANVALVSCAQVEICRGAIALSPGLDYRGVKPESALVDGLADRAALLVAAQDDRASSTAIRQMFLKAKGDVTARIYRGRAHGTRLFDSDADSVSRLILGWLAEHLPSLPAATVDNVCYLGDRPLGKNERLYCRDIPNEMRPITSEHCLYEHLDDRDNDGIVCE